MANFNAKGVRKGMVLPLNFVVSKVTERDGFRSIHLRASSLPNGFEGRDIVLKVPAQHQEVTLDEANQEL